MIADRLGQLEKSQQRWRQRAPQTPSDANSSPLTARLAALNTASEGWRVRVKNDMNEVRALTPVGKREARQQTLTPNVSCARSSQFVPLDKGLDRFFNVSGRKEETESSHCPDSFDSVPKTECLKTPQRVRPERKNRGRRRLITELAAVVPDSTIVERFTSPPDDDDTGSVAKSAIRGLQAVEEYTVIKEKLCSATEESIYPDLMLVRIRGEKYVDVRLVCPRHSSVHPFGVFLLVTRRRLFVYHGEYCNIMEKTKLTISILQKNDLDCLAEKVEMVQNEHSDFWKHLGDGPPVEEDPARMGVPFEIEAAQVNIIIRVLSDGSTQIVSEKEQPRFRLLDPNENLVFDFGSEIYAWSGRTASRRGTRCADLYLEQLAQKGVPVSDRLFGEDFSSRQRPSWIIARKIALGVYDALFASKFRDWKWEGEQRLKRSVPSDSPKPLGVEDALKLGTELANLEPPNSEIVLEETRLSDNPDVVTEGLHMWRLRDEVLDEETDWSPDLQQNCCYVFRWTYRVQISGVRKLNGKESERETGRERIAYFYWMGRETSKKEQGLCALALRELDRDRQPHIRIDDGLEPPLFLSLFHGKLVVYNGKSGIFIVKGSNDAEGHAVELEPGHPLRTHAVYIKVDERIHLHVGGDGELEAVRNGLVLADRMLEERKRKGLEGSMAEIEESIEDAERLKSEDWSAPRLFRLLEGDGCEVESPQWNEHNPFPHSQNSLVETVIVDTKRTIWLWSETSPSTFFLRVAKAFVAKRITCQRSLAVRKGSEPPSFQALFPTWSQWEDVEDTSPVRDLDELLEERTRAFPLEQLRSREELPEGMDTSSLQDHLSVEDFFLAFGMDRAEFDSLPEWKQIIKRKEACLF